MMKRKGDTEIRRKKGNGVGKLHNIVSNSYSIWEAKRITISQPFCRKIKLNGLYIKVVMEKHQIIKGQRLQ